MGKIKREEKNRGITLVALIFTILIILIIATIGISSGIETADSIKIRRFNDELQLIQGKVDLLYQQIQAGEKTQEELGGDSYENRKGIMDRTFDALNETEIVRGDYRYYTNQSLQTYLELEDIQQSVLINWTTRDVISVEGLKVDGVRYFRYQGWYKPQYQQETEKGVNVTTTTEKTGDITKVSVSVVEAINSMPVSDFTLKYKLEDDETYTIANSNYFETATSGTYIIQVSGNGLVTTTAEVTVEE